MEDLLVTDQGGTLTLAPASSLRRVDLWHVDDHEAAHRVEYYIGEKLVRADVSVFVRQGESVVPMQASLGG